MFTSYLRYPANRSPGLCARGGFRVLLVVLMDSVANDGDPGNGSGDDCKPLRGRARLPVANDLPAHGFTNNRGLLRPYRCRSLPQRKTKSFPYCLQTIVVLPGCAGLLGWRCRAGRRGVVLYFKSLRPDRSGSRIITSGLRKAETNYGRGSRRRGFEVTPR